MKQRAPYGEWDSPLSASAAAVAGIRIGPVFIAGSKHIFWTETVPEDGGRTAIMFSPKGRAGATTASPREFGEGMMISARSRVNEYGGGSYWIHGDPIDTGRVWWVASETQQVMVKGNWVQSRAVTPKPPLTRAWRYAAGVCTDDGRWSIVEAELQCDAAGTRFSESVNAIVAVDSESGTFTPLVEPGSIGSGDFVASPRLSPDGETLAWLRWDHPDMPWDGAELWAAHFSIKEGAPRLDSARRIAGGRDGGAVRGLGRPVSVCLPEFSPGGRLWWCDDSSDYWHLYSADVIGLPPGGSGDTSEPLLPTAKEEVGEPRWISGGSRYGFVDENTVVFAASADGLESVWIFDVVDRSRKPLPGCSFSYVESLVVSGTDVAVVGGSADQPTSVFHVDLKTGTAVDLRSASPPLEADWISRPSAIEVRSEVGVRCHTLFYPPQSGDFEGPDDEAPPLLIRIHGGPTAAARPEFSTSIQYWTSRGFAVADVNYRGSTGYGRPYRDMLRGQWGIADVEDCISVARHLAAEGVVDAKRCVIRGGSAGGFTALAAVCFQHEWGHGATFAAACSLYGVTDLAALASDTHKFESRYLDGLVGKYPAEAEAYRSRSPLFHADQLSEPVLLLQGTEDKIVPPSQAEVLVDAMAEKGVPHAYILFEGEGHGFLHRQTVVRALETELAFYGKVLGFEPAGDLPSIDLD